jgi:hypothetical protein
MNPLTQIGVGKLAKGARESGLSRNIVKMRPTTDSPEHRTTSQRLKEAPGRRQAKYRLGYERTGNRTSVIERPPNKASMRHAQQTLDLDHLQDLHKPFLCGGQPTENFFEGREKLSLDMPEEVR